MWFKVPCEPQENSISPAFSLRNGIKKYNRILVFYTLRIGEGIRLPPEHSFWHLSYTFDMFIFPYIWTDLQNKEQKNIQSQFGKAISEVQLYLIVSNFDINIQFLFCPLFLFLN